MSRSLPHFDGMQTSSPEGPAHGISDRICSGGGLVRQGGGGTEGTLTRLGSQGLQYEHGYTQYFGMTKLSGGLLVRPSPQTVEVCNWDRCLASICLTGASQAWCNPGSFAQEQFQSPLDRQPRGEGPLLRGCSVRCPRCIPHDRRPGRCVRTWDLVRYRSKAIRQLFLRVCKI